MTIMTSMDVDSEGEEVQRYMGIAYYTFRYTWPIQKDPSLCDASGLRLEKNPFARHKTYVIGLKELISKHSNQFTMGVEQFNKRAEKTWWHIHIAFTSSTKRDSLRRALMRFHASFELEFKGTKCYALTPWPDLKNLDGFWRYPLKQYSTVFQPQSFPIRNSQGFPPEKLEEMRKIAHAHWLEAVSVWQTKVDKNDKSDTLFEELYAYCRNRQPLDVRKIARLLIEHYAEHNRPINLTVIKGYTYNIAFKENILSADYLIERMQA